MKQLEIEYVPKFSEYSFYLDQIEDVVTYIQSQGCNEIAIQALGYEVDDVSKLKELNKINGNELKISGKGEQSLSININISSSNVVIYVYCRDWTVEQKNGVVASIEKILKRGDKKYLSRLMVLAILPWGAPIILLLSSSAFREVPASLTISWVILYYLVIALYLFVFQYGTFNNTIFFERKRDLSTFLKRNGDRILMLTVGWVLGLFFNFFPPIHTGEAVENGVDEAGVKVIEDVERQQDKE